MLSFRREGRGKPLILLHAFPLSSTMWEDQIKILSKKFQVIAPDLPGFGGSDLMPDVTMEEMARQVKMLLEHLKVEEPVFMAGLSMGGYAAFEFLRHFPESLCGLALFSTRATADTPAAKENRFKSIEAMEKFGLEPFAKKAVKSQLGKSTQEKNPKLTEKTLKSMIQNTAGGAIAAQKAMASRRDSTELLSRIQFPVLVMAGEEDEISPVAEMKDMQSKVKNPEFHVIPKSGHLIQWEQPEIFQTLFSAFLRKHLGKTV